MTRTAALALLAFAALAPLGGWSGCDPRVLTVLVLLLPGWVLTPVLGDARSAKAPERVAIALSLSLVLLALGIAPLFAMGMPLHAATYTLAAGYAIVALVALGVGPTGADQESPRRWEWGALAATAAILVPAVLRYAGGSVDDWWDIAYVRAFADRAALEFSEPMLGTGAVHPRFAWNVWTLTQGLVVALAGGEPVELQATVIAPLVCVASIAAVFALSRSVFAGERRAVLAAVWLMPFWLYGTDALPYFTRVHQDKFVAALVLMPVLLASAIDYLERPSRRRLALVAAHALATCSVHSLVFGVASLGVAFCALASVRAGRERRGWYSVHRPGAARTRDLVELALVGLVVAALPAWQALALRGWFAGGRVAIAIVDNPVVRAHLALDRLIAPDAAYMIVRPSAIFGAIGVLCVVGTLCALARKRPGDRYLLALTLGPMAVIFVPFIAAAVGALSVPWMLYRIGWLIPQPLLLARLLVPVLETRWRFVRLAGTAAIGLALVGLSVPVAADRARRGMREHPYVRELQPRGTTREVYGYLRAAAERSPVLAPAGFSSLVPAVTGRPVVAFSERGTLVFAKNELDAYRRIRDRAVFYSCATDVATRVGIAQRYEVGHAVFRRRYVTSGDELAWLDRATAEGILMAEDPSFPIACSLTEEALARAIPPRWSIVLANRDYFVVAIPESDRTGASPARTPEADRDWSVPFELSAIEVPRESHVLASATGFPGAVLHLDPPPVGFGAGEELAWASGGALWDDGPSEVAIEVAMPAACEVVGIEIRPYLETARREVLELRIDGRRWRARARDGHAIRIALEPALRDRVQLEVASLFGLTFGLADVRLLGDPRTCEQPLQPRSDVGSQAASVSIPRLLELTARYPRSPQLVSSIARRRRDDGAAADAMALLRRALTRDGEQAAPWIEYGLLLDRAGRFDDARAAYARARAVDSNSAWAYGCLAWAELRARRALPALWHSWRAHRLDRRYADALTIHGLALEQLGFGGASARALETAMAMEPRRDWPYLERARQLAAAGKKEDARAVLRRYRALVPDDVDVTEALRSLADDAARS